MRYYVQFTAGTRTLTQEALGAQLDEMRVRYADDSAMVVESPSPPDVVAAASFVKNAFVVIAETRRGAIDKGLLQLARVAEKRAFPELPDTSGRFRVMVHVDGSLTPVSPRSRSAVERTISARTAARLEPRGMCQEYWIVGRQGLDDLLLCGRLPKRPRPPKAKGAISHELSAMLVVASHPTPRDVFLDPFAGSGSFATARLELPVGHVWCSDIDLERHRPDLPRQLTGNRRVTLLAEDALSLPSIGDGSIDAIVTDPPWGEHEDVGQPYEAFARAIGMSFARVLHPERGRYVLLVNRRNAATMTDGLAAAGIAPEARHDILVNGHPATVLIGNPVYREIETRKTVSSP